MTAPIKLDDPLIDLVVDALQGRKEGLSRMALARVLGFPMVKTRWLLTGVAASKRAVAVWGVEGKASNVVWALPGHAEVLQAALRKAAIARRSVRQRERREIVALGLPAAQDNDEFDLPNVTPLPVRQSWVNTWQPVTQAPGPISVFHCGA